MQQSIGEKSPAKGPHIPDEAETLDVHSVVGSRSGMHCAAHNRIACLQW